MPPKVAGQQQGAGGAAAPAPAGGPAKFNLKTQPPTMVPTISNADRIKGVQDASSQGSKSSQKHGKDQAYNDTRQKNSAESQRILAELNKRMEQPNRFQGQFAEILMTSARDSWELAIAYNKKFFDGGGPIGSLKRLWNHALSNHKVTTEDLAKAIQVDDKGHISVAEMLSLPMGKGKHQRFEEVKMSDKPGEFRDNLRKGLYGFLQQRGCEVEETKDAEGKVLYAEVYKKDALGNRNKLDKAQIEKELGVKVADFKAALDVDQNSPRPK
jgi:hypothetical protein